MLLPWLDLPGASERLARWSELTGLDLVRLGTTAEAHELRDTAVAQPMLTVAALLSGRALTDAGVLPDAVSGHSIGEIPALALAGVLTDDDAVRLSAGRGAAMARAAALSPTGMSAVLGGDREEVLAAGQALGLELSTVNVAGQVVLGGPLPALAELAAAPPAGARVRPLEVAGAFHTVAMAPAADELGKLVADLQAGAPTASVVANADGAVVPDGKMLLDRLVAQLTGPVRFDLCLQTLAGLTPTGVVELAPGGTLAGMAKRSLPGVSIVALKSPADLEAARALVEASA
ncbi:MAG: S-malonyltransferase [Frankiales bacterium]|nr:S-malonyltransferase [Frankiales bacterium]